MPFYMNVFDQEFRGNLLLGDRQHIPTFPVPPNKNKSDQMIAWNNSTYDLSSDNTLTINYAIDPQMKAFSAISINVAGGTASATTAAEIVVALNANSTFLSLFTASEKKWVDRNRISQSTVFIQAKRPAQSIRAYISNSSAEKKLRFNKYAGIAEIPSFFDRHQISNSTNPESEGMLIKLDGTDTAVDRVIIREFLQNTAWTNSDLQADYALLAGRSGLFQFKKQTVDGSNRITQIIEYSAGAVAGDFAKKINYTYSGANTSPTNITEIPYVLATGDLITPP